MKFLLLIIIGLLLYIIGGLPLVLGVMKLALLGGIVLFASLGVATCILIVIVAIMMIIEGDI